MCGCSRSNGDSDSEEIAKDYHRSDSQLVVNSVNGKINVPKDIINFAGIKEFYPLVLKTLR